ncbi:hypothetical protein D9M69_242800 [compost metagenome]
MVEDVQRLVEVDERVEREAGGVLQPVLVANLLRQLGISARFSTQLGQLLEQFAVALAEGGDTRRVLAVDHATVGQHQAQAGEGLVGILRGTAAHAAGIVGDDATDLGRVDRRRVRADLALERRQHGIGAGTDHPRLQANLHAFAANVAAVPVVAEDDQHRVADRLAGQAGAGGAEGHRHLLGMGQLEQFDHLAFGFDAQDQLRNQPVEAGIGAESEGRQRIIKTPLQRD